MATMSKTQNLLIQIQKIHTNQTLQLEVGLIQLNEIFTFISKTTLHFYTQN